MSDFVNYNKRSVTLPPGCKDLIDALRPHGLGVEWLREHAGIDLSRAVRRGGMLKGPVQDIEQHVQKAVSSVALAVTVCIVPVDERVTFSLARVLEEPLRASINVETKTREEAAVRQFLSNHHLQAPDDSATPGHFLPDMPVHLICLVLPLPSDSVVLAGLVRDLFREASGLTEESELSFHHYELANAA